MASPGHIEVSSSTHMLTSLATGNPGLWKKLGNLESRIVSTEIERIPISAPIYVSGLARSGSTILLEMLADHPDTCAHTYGDFPFLFTPVWWNMAMRLRPGKSDRMQERAHGDGIQINQSSPEAMEEMLWMAYFSYLHTAQQSEI
ncbi:MAG: sulfotransferase, partial [Alphaproteobacteria bacterium]